MGHEGTMEEYSKERELEKGMASQHIVEKSRRRSISGNVGSSIYGAI